RQHVGRVVDDADGLPEVGADQVEQPLRRRRRLAHVLPAFHGQADAASARQLAGPAQPVGSGLEVVVGGATAVAAGAVLQQRTVERLGKVDAAGQVVELALPLGVVFAAQVGA